MSYLEQAKELSDAYSRQSRTYGKTRNHTFDEFLKTNLQLFATAALPFGRRVLDLGSGPGHESEILQTLRLEPVCVDSSQGMVDECRRKGLEAHQMSFEQLSFDPETFAGAWMSFSLLHVPKNRCDLMLKGIHSILCTGAPFAVSLFEGDGEGPRLEDIPKFGCARYFAYYQVDELTRYLEKYFSIVHMTRLDASPRPSLFFLARKG